jgi:transcriptional regulator with XRE-family HTH domain
VPTPSKYKRDPILIALGAAIRAQRRHKNLSQETLAHLADVDRSYLGQVERGENSVALHPLVRIAKALDITVADLFSEAEL